MGFRPIAGAAHPFKLLFPTGRQYKARSFVGKRVGQRFADARRSPGDPDDLILKTHGPCFARNARFQKAKFI